MKYLYFLLFVNVSIFSFSQNEANIWYFGDNAGLDFSSGDPIVINDGHLSTIEGCSTTSDSNGNLLFYTDGKVVYNKNHEIMDNGNNLGGNPSSSQSAIVVPKPNNQGQYYIFTVDEHNVNINGLQYSIVDMTLNSGLGGVISSQKNISLLEHCSEKITAVKGDDCDSVWLIAFSSQTGVFLDYQASHIFDTFHAFKITSTGVSSSITSSVNNTTNDGRGYLKVSADGTKIAIANSFEFGKIGLYDFDIITGIVSNEKTIMLNDVTNSNNSSTTEPYGIEFSLDTSKLYITSIASGRQYDSTPHDGFLWQYDINSSSNIAKLISFNPNYTYRGALQMGPNGKIYRALSSHYFQGSNYLGVINFPNKNGILCDYQHDAIDLGSGISRQGLPPFIQSLFLPNVDIINDGSGIFVDKLDLCEGDTYTLQPDTSTYPSTTTYEWLFNDLPIIPAVTTSSIIIDKVNYGSGNYKIIIDFNDGDTCPFYGKAKIFFNLTPNIISPIVIKQCDDNTDGWAYVDLTLANSVISDDSENENILYFNNQSDAENGNTSLSISNSDNYYTESTGSNPLWVRVENNFCYTIEQVDIIVSTSNINFNRTLYKCDDYVENESLNDDGKSIFDLTQVENDLLLEFPISQQPNLSFTYFRNLNDAQLQNSIDNPSAFRNEDVDSERIFIRVDNNSNIDCVGMGIDLYVDVVVEKLPIANTISSIRTCETFVGYKKAEFDTTQIPNLILQGQTNVILNYFKEDDNGDLVEIPSFISSSFLSESITITIIATNNSTNDPDGACYDETTLDLIVDDLPEANAVSIQILCDDLPDQNDGMSVFETSNIKTEILGGSLPNNMEIHYYYPDGTEVLPTLPNQFNTTTQIIDVEVFNKENATCVATTEIDFRIVVDNPIFNVPDQLLCLNLLPSPMEVYIEDALDNYTYTWQDYNGNIIPTKDNDTSIALITKGGEYSVTALSLSQCTTTLFFNVKESSIPNIEMIKVFDNSTDNQIYLIVSGAGDYKYSLDNNDYEDGNTVDGHIFYYVKEGIHTIYIKDNNGCNPIIEKEVLIIKFPRYISPNGDGVNDEFYIIGGNDLIVSTVTIFDRFGKIIKVLNGNEKWNGIYRDKAALETEYWFLVNFIDLNGVQREYKGNFSLKK